MKIKDVLRFLETKAPSSLSQSFDNTGMLVGNPEDEITGILIALDCFSEIINKAIENKCNLIITHHPVIFTPLKNVLKDNIVYKLISNNISVISMHTNLDIAEGGVNDALCGKLGLENIKTVTVDDFPIRVGEIDNSISPDEFAARIKVALKGFVKYVSPISKIKTVAVCSGSGSGFYNSVKDLMIDAYVTSEVKHHDFVAAFESGICLFDAGHFNTENVIVDTLANILSTEFPHINVVSCEFEYIKNV